MVLAFGYCRRYIGTARKRTSSTKATSNQPQPKAPATPRVKENQQKRATAGSCRSLKHCKPPQRRTLPHLPHPPWLGIAWEPRMTPPQQPPVTPVVHVLVSWRPPTQPAQHPLPAPPPVLGMGLRFMLSALQPGEPGFCGFCSSRRGNVKHGAQPRTPRTPRTPCGSFEEHF